MKRTTNDDDGPGSDGEAGADYNACSDDDGAKQNNKYRSNGLWLWSVNTVSVGDGDVDIQDCNNKQ